MRATLLLCLGLFVVSTCAQKRICVKKSQTEKCQILEGKTTEVKCTIVTDSVDCMSKLVKGKADFGVFTAEEALLVATAEGNSTRVIAELRHKARLEQDYAFKTVAVVRKSYTGGLSGLRGKSYCHLGFDKSHYWTDTVSKAFEKKIAGTSSCNSDLTYLEDETKALSDFFGPTCRPGHWSASNSQSNQLKKKYSKLCAKCDNPSNCTYNDPRTGALDCLTRNGGADVAYTALDTVRQYFAYTPNNSSVSPSDYQFLCPNGTYQNIDTANPCAFITQPWDVIISHKDRAKDSRDFLTHLMDKREDWRTTLIEILHETSKELIFFSNPHTPETTVFISGKRNIPSKSGNRCHPNITWCTVGTEERDKCGILSDLTRTHDIVPNIQCYDSVSKQGCLLAVNSSKADIVAIDTALGYQARRLFKLSPVMYVESQTQGNYYGIVLASADSKVTSAKDLKAKRACFPAYSDLGWLTFMEVAVNNKQLSAKACPNAKQTFQHFSESCAPGSDNVYFNPLYKTEANNGCDACRRGSNESSCEIIPNNKYFGSKGALRCLASGAGEVAFVNYNTIKDDLNSMSDALAKNLTKSMVVCKDAVIPFTPKPDISKCAFTHFTGSEIVASPTLSKSRLEEIQMTLLEVNDWFASKSLSHNKILDLFAEFNKTNDVLLTSSGTSLVDPAEATTSFVTNYNAMHDRLQHCSDARATSPFFFLILVSVPLFIVRV